MNNTSTPQPTTRAMRWILLIASGLVFAAGTQLFVLTEQTERFFAWTIGPPGNLFLTAAFLGASYWASGILEFLASRERTWAHARVAVPTVLTFTLLTLVVTLLHINAFHFSPPAESYTIFLTWAWLAIYAGVPLALSVILIMQLRAPGRDTARAARLPRWMRLTLFVQAAVMIGLGVLMFATPPVASAIWPWKLTALTARAIAAWLIGLGIAAGHTALENDLARTRAGLIAYAAFGILQLIALVRYPGDVNWSDARAWLYVLFILSVLTVGVSGWLSGRNLLPDQ